MKQVVRTFAPSLALGICVLFGASACNESGSSNGGGGGGQPIVSQNSPTFAPTPVPQLNQPFAMPEIKPPAFEPPKPAPIADIKPEQLLTPPSSPKPPGTIPLPSGSSLPSAPVISGPGGGLPIPVHSAPLVEPPKPTFKFEADLKLVEFDLTNRRRSRGTTIYDIVPNGVERKIKTKNVQCHASRSEARSIFIQIESGDDKVTLSIPNFSKTRHQYEVPLNEISTEKRGVVMYQLKEQVRFSAMKNSFEEQLESKCKIDLTVENGQLNGVVACERLADAKALETADLLGTFSCAANE